MVEHKDLGITVDVRLRFHSHVSNVVQKAAGLASNQLRAIVNREADSMVSFFLYFSYKTNSLLLFMFVECRIFSWLALFRVCSAQMN